MLLTFLLQKIWGKNDDFDDRKMEVGKGNSFLLLGKVIVDKLF